MKWVVMGVMGLLLGGSVFLVDAPPLRQYHGVLIADVATTPHTHVCVTGRVTVLRHEPDGDLHIRVENRQGQFVVVEWLPSTQVVADEERVGDRGAPVAPLPRVGQWGIFCGISREDKKHKWFEVHPLEHWRVVR